MRITGTYEKFNNIQFFIPYSLPPAHPPLELSGSMMILYGQAMHELGRLNEIVNNVPDTHRFIKAYVIKEALLSSSIEGIHTSLLEVFTQPLLESKPNKDTQLVMNYGKALDAAVALIKEGLPVSSRIVLTAHEELMQGQGAHSAPGQYRKQIVKVGQLVPPPPLQIATLISELERFINDDQSLPALVKAGLAHVQFETIHPFLDGNGRIGRLLIVLMLLQDNLLKEPILYLSYYFKKHHLEYYQKLDRVRTHGDFEGWVEFYLTAIKESSIDAYRRIKDIEILLQKMMSIVQLKWSGNKSELRIRALTIFFSFPVINVNELARQLDISYNTAHQIILDFVGLGLLLEQTQQKRGKLFKFVDYLDVLEREYE